MSYEAGKGWTLQSMFACCRLVMSKFSSQSKALGRLRKKVAKLQKLEDRRITKLAKLPAKYGFASTREMAEVLLSIGRSSAKGKRTHRRLTPTQLASLKKKLVAPNAKKNIAPLAREFGVSYPTVLYHFIRLGTQKK